MGFDLVLGLGYSDAMEGPLKVHRKLDSMTNFEPSLTLGLHSESHQGAVDLYSHASPRSDVVSSFPRDREVCSDEDENGVNGRKKLRLTKEQSALLEDSFKQHSTLNPKQKQALARQINLRPRQVEVWFQNRRARTKLKQTEIDCEFLKKCCEKLTDENRRLQKELQELKASKSGHPFYMHIPAANLTICPSCEIIGGGSDNRGSKNKVLMAPKAQFYNPFTNYAAC